MIEVKLPYPVKFGFFRVYISKRIGFSFDQRALFLMLENNDIDLPNHKEWLKKTPQSVVINETLYAAALSYKSRKWEKPNFTKKGLTGAFTEASEETMQKIFKAWKDSEKLGFKDIPSKKKAVSR